MIRWLARVLQEQDADTLWLQSKFFSGKTEVRKESLLKSFKDEFVCLPLTISCTRESYYCCHPFVVYLEVNFSIWEYLFLVFNTLLTPLFLLFNENVTVKWSDSKTNRTLKGYLVGYDFMMTFREILNSSLLARACSWLLHSIFLKYQIIFFCISSIYNWTGKHIILKLHSNHILVALKSKPRIYAVWLMAD